MTIERAGGGRRGVKRSFDDVYDSFLDEWAFERSQVFGARAQRGAEMATEPLGGVADRRRHQRARLAFQIYFVVVFAPWLEPGIRPTAVDGPNFVP